MGMTHFEQLAKEQIMDLLAKQGYPTYARILDLFDLHLTHDPESVAFMIPDRGIIVINAGLDTEQVSVVVRHEILHQYLEHYKRMKAHLGDQYDKRDSLDHDIENIADDYEISNRGYTDADKKIVRSILLDGKVLKGLVTEDKHAAWTNLSAEEMYDKLEAEKDKVRQQIQQELKDIQGQQKQNQSAQGASNQSAPSDSIVRIGDAGNPATQASEELARIAQILKEKGEDQQQQLGKDAADLSKQIKDNADQAKDKPIPTPEEQKEKEEEAKKAAAIKKAFDNLIKSGQLDKENQENQDKDAVAQAAADADSYKNSPLSRFKLSLNTFIKNQIIDIRGDSWSKINKKYYNTGIIKPGISRRANTLVPLINVYFDRSGSWDDEKTAVGERAISTLNKYVQQHQIQIKLYYFSTAVYSTRKEAEQDSGTSGECVIKHVIATHPDNVIVMTDSDCDVDAKSRCTVPGAVWYLFKGGESLNMTTLLKGKQLTKYFDI